MSDFSKPQTSDLFSQVPGEINSIASDLALGLDPALTSPKNIPTNAIRWNSANGFWEKLTGSAWGALTAIYNIVAAQAVKLQTPRNITLTGDLSGTVIFDGTADASIKATLLNVTSTVGTFGSSFAVPVLSVNAKGQVVGATTAIINVVNLLGYTPVANTPQAIINALGYTPANAANLGQNWTITGDTSKIYFKFNGNTVFSINSSGVANALSDIGIGSV